ncbi:MAG: hypothetical protein AB7T06_45400 [Kofleriaceae bacterium]
MRVVALLVFALAACKARSQLPIGEECEDDKMCAEGLYCSAGLGKGKKCLKPCGPTAIEAQRDEPVDTSCPTGWSCSATLVNTYKDKNGDEHSSFNGWMDRAMCVPDGWTAEPRAPEPR